MPTLRVARLDEPAWNQVLAKASCSTVFHSWSWSQLVCTVLGGEFHPMAIVSGEQHLHLAPVFSGKPWADKGAFRLGAIGYGGPLPTSTPGRSDPPSYSEIANLIKLIEAERGESCSGATLFPHRNWKPDDDIALGCAHLLDIKSNTEHMFNEILTGNVRTAIRKALHSSVTVRGISIDELATAHTMLNQTQLLVGAAYQTPLSLLEALITMESPKGLVLGAFIGNRMISMGVFLISNRDAFHLFNGWDRTAAAYCPNQLLLWSAVLESQARGASVLNLGESHYPSLAQAKERWGAIPIPVARLNSVQLVSLNGTPRSQNDSHS